MLSLKSVVIIFIVATVVPMCNAVVGGSDAQLTSFALYRGVARISVDRITYGQCECTICLQFHIESV